MKGSSWRVPPAFKFRLLGYSSRHRRGSGIFCADSACEHLAAWTERNAEYGAQLGQELVQRGVVAELIASNRVTQWAYAQAEAANALIWAWADEMVPLAAEWRELIAT